MNELVDTDTLTSGGFTQTQPQAVQSDGERRLARSRVIRRPRRAWSPAARTAATIAAAMAIVACGGSSPSPGVQTNPNQAQAQQDTLNFARCMRSHGVSNFPDDLNVRDVPGINPSSPAFKSAQTACRHLLPVKTGPSAAPSATTRAKMLRLSNCLRAHGYPSMPDPRPNPPPPGGSPAANRYSALFGEGDYWIGIPRSVNAHGAAFIHALHECHTSPGAR